MPELDDYRYRGARALVLLHERQLPLFLERWREAKAVDLKLPETSDTDYESLETLLVHVLRASKRYLVWMCEKLELPAPRVPNDPTEENVESIADEYLRELLAAWREPWREIPEERFGGRSYKSRWGDDMTIESMLEHAVVHPMRHTFQLDELLALQRVHS